MAESDAPYRLHPAAPTPAMSQMPVGLHVASVLAMPGCGSIATTLPTGEFEYWLPLRADAGDPGSPVIAELLFRHVVTIDTERSRYAAVAVRLPRAPQPSPAACPKPSPGPSQAGCESPFPTRSVGHA